MNPNHSFHWIHELLCELSAVSSEEECSDLLEKYHQKHSEELDSLILHDVEVLIQARILSSSDLRRLSNLSSSEREELEEAEHIINENLFAYYFQPIVNAADGEIDSY